jgi:predicted nucleic acid-binding protein
VIVIDASALLEALLRTSIGEALRARLYESPDELHAPHLLDLEIANVLRRYARNRVLTAERCRMALADMANFPIYRYSHDFMVPRIWQLRDNLSAYDAAYVALAEMLGAPLLTHDRRVAGAVGHRAQIELV